MNVEDVKNILLSYSCLCTPPPESLGPCRVHTPSWENECFCKIWDEGEGEDKWKDLREIKSQKEESGMKGSKVSRHTGRVWKLSKSSPQLTLAKEMTQFFPFQERRRERWWVGEGMRTRECIPGVRGKHKRKESWTPAHEGWICWCQFEKTSRTWSLQLIPEEVSGIIDFICSSPAWLIHVSGYTHTLSY